MDLITKVDEMVDLTRKARVEGKTIGFVPTMGYLHEGHLSLVRAAVSECDMVVMSIFVNPTQFGPDEDLMSYPRDLEGDKKKALSAGVDLLFAPVSAEMYPMGFSTAIEVSGDEARGLCGRSRPGHFKGVVTVVAKLLNITGADRAYFGRKDAQQAAVIRRMVSDLNMSVAIRTMPIVREPDGLAMSSRNSYLKNDQRENALRINRALNRAKEMVEQGERDPSKVKDRIRSVLLDGEGVEEDYIEIVDAETMTPVNEVGDNTLIAIAARVGGVRLIDNIVTGEQ